MSDFAFLDGFEGYDSELPIASPQFVPRARAQMPRVKSLSWRRWAASPRQGASPGMRAGRGSGWILVILPI